MTLAYPRLYDAVPYGLEAQLVYNGLTLNAGKKLTAGTTGAYFLTAIGGLDDGDLSVSADQLPDRDGELPLIALYRGRTITVTGYILALNPFRLRQMQHDLRVAANSLVEQALTFSVGDVYSGDVFLNCRKGAPLAMREELRGDPVFRRDFQVTLRASDPRFYAATAQTARTGYNPATGDLLLEAMPFNSDYRQDSWWGLQDNFSTDTRNHWVYYGCASSDFSTSGGVLTCTGTPTSLKGLEAPLNPGYADVIVTVKHHTPGTGTIANYTASACARIVGGLGGTMVTATASGSTIVVAKRNGGVSTTLATTAIPAIALGTDYWVRLRCEGNTVIAEHWLTDPLVSGHSPAATARAVLGGGDVALIGSTVVGTAGLFWTPLAATATISVVLAGPGTLTNNGSYRTFPVLTVNGPFNAGLVVADTTTGTLFGPLGVIAGGRTLTFDSTNRTATDSLGANVYSIIDPASDWLSLAPGANRLALSGAAGTSNTSRVSASWRSAWI